LRARECLSQIEALFKALPRQGSLSLRDRALFMLLYNTGARVQEIADLRVGDVDLEPPLRARPHGKGDKWILRVPESEKYDPEFIRKQQATRHDLPSVRG
jgi:site-specific recombinase XerD